MVMTCRTTISCLVTILLVGCAGVPISSSLAPRKDATGIASSVVGSIHKRQWLADYVAYVITAPNEGFKPRNWNEPVQLRPDVAQEVNVVFRFGRWRAKSSFTLKPEPGKTYQVAFSYIDTSFRDYVDFWIVDLSTLEAVTPKKRVALEIPFNWGAAFSRL